MAETTLRRNIELKARIASIEAAREVARRIATEHVGLLVQTDTYFHCRTGRLKLRETDTRPAQLVWYARPDEQGPKTSKYLLVPVEDAAGLKRALAAALDIRSLVSKRREVYLYHNVRIHLDEVQGLGTFLEFEAVLEPDQNEADGRAQVERLAGQFGVAASDLLDGSYGEMAKPSPHR